MKLTERAIRDEALRRVMWDQNRTNDAITRYIADAVAEKVVRDEELEREAANDE